MEVSSSSTTTTARRPPPWVILSRLTRGLFDDPDPANPGKVSLALAKPPSVSTLTVPTSHYVPNSLDYDRHPYVVAADPAGLLIHVYGLPYIGFYLDSDPNGTLVVVRDFRPVDTDDGEKITGTAIRVPSRLPLISNIKNVGLVFLPGSGGADYIVAELLNHAADLHARLLYFRSGTPGWVRKDLHIPTDIPAWWLPWDSDEVISHDGKLWWVNLSWGLLSLNPFDDHPVLRYTNFPDRMPIHNQHPLQQFMGVGERWRFVRRSKGKLRYVEITLDKSYSVDGTMLAMWTLQEDASADDRTWWSLDYQMMFGQLWASGSYTATGMPKELPVLATVHPSNPAVVYFFLRQYLFGVNVRESRVVQAVEEPYGLVKVSRGAWSHLLPPISWRFVLAWKLPPSLSREPENSPAQEEEPENTEFPPEEEACDWESSGSAPSPN